VQLHRRGAGGAGDREGLALPFSIRVLLEAALRNNNGFEITDADVMRLAQWSPQMDEVQEIPFKPARVILQDFTGVPSLVDLAALRSAMQRMGGDPSLIQRRSRSILVFDTPCRWMFSARNPRC